LRVYCSSSCQQKDWKIHGLKCKNMVDAMHQLAQADKGKGKGKGKKRV
jgi:hypothetical protein